MFKAYLNYWKDYFNFTGKSSNADYWWVFLMNYLIGIIWWLIVVSIVIVKVTNWHGQGDNPFFPNYSHDYENLRWLYWNLSLIGQIWIAVNFIPNLSIITRRLRDAGFHWGLVFISAIPNAYFFIYRMVHLIMTYVTDNYFGSTGATMTLLNMVYSVVGLSCYIIMIVLCTRPTQSVQGQAGAGFIYQDPTQAQGIAGQAFPYATQAMPAVNQSGVAAPYQVPQQAPMTQVGQANPFGQPQSQMSTFQQVPGQNNQQPAQHYQQANVAPQPQQTMQNQVTSEVQPAISEQASPITSEASQMSENLENSNDKNNSLDPIGKLE